MYTHLCNVLQCPSSTQNFIFSTILAIFKKNSFQSPIRTLVKILEKPETHVKYFLMLYLSAKFQVCWLIQLKVLAIFKKKSFQSLIRPLVQILEKPRTRIKYFFDSLPLCKISGLLVHPFQSSSHI